MQRYILIYVILIFHTNADNAQFENYLEERQKYVANELNRQQRDSINDERVSINFGGSHVVTLGNMSDAHTFTLFGHNYLLSAAELFAIGNETNKYILTSLDRFPEVHEKIAFIKTIEFDGVGYMLATFQDGDACRIFRFVDNTLQPKISIQTISTPNRFNDALFFISNASLYLIATSGGPGVAPLIVYKWEHSHFDQIHQMYVEGAIGISQITIEGNVEVILILRKKPFNSIVYEFRNELLNKIQMLDDDKATHILTFAHENATFLILFNDKAMSMLYRWKDEMFGLLEQFHADPGVQQVFLTHVNNIPIIVTVTNESITFFTILSDTIQHLSSLQVEQHLSKVLSVQITELAGEQIVLILGATDNSELHFIVTPMTLEQSVTVNSIPIVDELEQCLQDLETLIKQHELEQQQANNEETTGRIEEASNTANKSVHHETIHEPVVTERIISLNDSSHATNIPSKNAIKEKPESAKLQNKNDVILQQKSEIVLPDFPDFEEHFDRIQNELQDLEQQSKELWLQLENVINDDVLIFNDKITIGGRLNVQNLSAQNAHLVKINGINWTPNAWLNYNQDQVITTPLSMDTFKVRDLHATNNKLFQDMLVPSDSAILLSGLHIAGSLSASSIFAPQINGIAMESVYLRSAPVQITGNKSFNNVHAADLHATALNGHNASLLIHELAHPQADRFEFPQQVHVEELNVETINGVNWKNFSGSVFRIGHAQTIKGNLTVASVKSSRMQAKQVKGVPVDTLLTTNTEQDIQGVLHIAALDAPNVHAEDVNGLDFAADVVRYSNASTTVISTPVTIKTMHITGNLEVNGSLHEFYKQNAIVGTHPSDMLQIYGNKVKINGDLHVPANMQLLAAAKLFISGNEFNQAHFDEYWLKTTNQEVPVHIEVQNGISIPHLTSKLLNDIRVGDYMRNNNANKMRTTFHFENATILGDVVIDGAKLQHQPDLERLNSQAVKLNGSYVIRGVKQFTGKIGVEHLKTDQINDVQAKVFLAQDHSALMSAKFVHNLTVQSINVRNLSMTNINGMSLPKLQENAVFIDQNIELESVHFSNVTVMNLTTNRINNRLFNEYLMDLKKLDSLQVLNRLEINGNVSIANASGVGFINNINMLTTIDEIPSYDSEQPIKGTMEFSGKVHIKELFVNDMNNISVPEFIGRLFYRNWPQNITARHHFKVLNTPNLFTPQINNVKTRYLVNVNSHQPQLIHIESGLHLTNSQFGQSLYANFSDCDIHKAIASIHNVPKRFWHSLYVENITLAENTSQLARLLYNAVHTKKDNIILAPTHLHHIHADSVLNRNLINAIDLQHIIDDALRHNTTNQVVTGRKEFAQITSAELVADGRVDLGDINGLNIAAINRSIVSVDEGSATLIKGHKTFFAGLQTEQLHANSLGDILPEDLVTRDSDRTIAKLTFDDLSVTHRMQLEIVNNLNFSFFLQDRLLLHAGREQVATANYYFDELQLNGKTSLPSINDIHMDDVVFDEHVQIITAPKKFTQSLVIAGDAVFAQLNEFPLGDFFEQAIILQKPANITENVRLLAPTQISGEIQAKSINGIPFDQLNELIQSDNHRVRTEIIHDTLKEIKKLVADNTAALRGLSHQFLYLEKSDTLHIELEHAYGAQVERKKDDSVMLHVLTAKPGNACGLAAHCVCPSQQTIAIRPNLSWHAIDNKYEQRIFSFEATGVLVNVITNTKSRSAACSANTGQEYTSVNWYTLPNANATGDAHSFPEHIIGYVSDVQFFALDGHVYVIIAKMFDTAHNATLAESMVLRLAKNHAHVEQIQRIRTMGAAHLHVFHTAQAVHLIVGNVGGQLQQEGILTTDIYTFNRESKLFEIIRSVPSSGCLSATSIVLSLDSLIVLTQIDGPLIVLHYNPFYKNYFILGSFLHDNSVSSVSVFYTGEFGESDAYLTAVAERGQFFIYSYHFLFGWKLEAEGYMEGLNALTPLHINRQQYLFASSSTTTSSVLNIVKQGF